jgi:pyridinium-3,5-biscarboxylic acid mononucleotide synthase
VAAVPPQLDGQSVADLGFAQVDLQRRQRCGFPEVIFCEGKTPEWIEGVVRQLAAAEQDCLATRINAEQSAHLARLFPQASQDRVARTFWLPAGTVERTTVGHVVVLTAGTSDLPVAQEAAVTARALGCDVKLLADVGVAGIHRLLAQQDSLKSARVLIVCAGMEGALPTVVGGLVNAPVIAVPTSVGYGASLGGVAALLGMLNTCSPNVSVVNIDNGFGAACIASLINHL